MHAMTRREFLAASTLSLVQLNLEWLPQKLVRFAAITDIHHGLAPDAYQRMEAFVAAVGKRKDLDFVLQMGDFCHPWPLTEVKPFLALWNSIKLPRHHVLGNHDMDRGSKAEIMTLWDMPSRYGSFVAGDWRFLVLDLNHFRKDRGLHAYERGNYFTDNATHNWADPEQLEWLRSVVADTSKPTIVLSHQPLGFGEEGKPLPPEQREVLDILKGKVAACLCGHLHVDRLAQVDGLPCYCLNSASYFWQGGMHPYRDPLFAFIEIGTDGVMRVEGVRSEFVKGKPETQAIGCSASIENRRVKLS
jgi:hypothetical protein